MHGRDLMKAYTDYCKIWGNQPKSRANFKADLLQAGFIYNEKLRVNGAISTGYVFYKIDFEDGDEIGMPNRTSKSTLFSDEDFSNDEPDLPF